jgi:hypothetical protein
MPEQIEINFGSPQQQEDGFQAWLNQRRLAMTRLAQQLGLPLGRRVEVWLKGDLRLDGVLELAQGLLFVPEDRNPKLELRIDRCTFVPGDIESCVRLD